MRGETRRHDSLVRAAMDALGRKTCGAARTVKPCGPVPPTLGSSLIDTRFRPRGRNAEIDKATEANKPGLRGERGVSRKAIAQGVPCDFGPT